MNIAFDRHCWEYILGSVVVFSENVQIIINIFRPKLPSIIITTKSPARRKRDWKYIYLSASVMSYVISFNRYLHFCLKRKDAEKRAGRLRFSCQLTDIASVSDLFIRTKDGVYYLAILEIHIYWRNI